MIPRMALKRLRLMTRPLRRRLAQLIYSHAGPLSATEKDCQAYRELASAALSGQLYFGDALMAFRGDPMRQRHFPSVVAKVAATATGPIRVLEIGSWAGSSAIAWANALRKSGKGGSIVCVDPWIPYASAPRSMDDALYDDMIYRLFQHNVRVSGVESMIEVRRGGIFAPSWPRLPLLPSTSLISTAIIATRSCIRILRSRCGSRARAAWCAATTSNASGTNCLTISMPTRLLPARTSSTDFIRA